MFFSVFLVFDRDTAINFEVRERDGLANLFVDSFQQATLVQIYPTLGYFSFHIGIPRVLLAMVEAWPKKFYLGFKGLLCSIHVCVGISQTFVFVSGAF